MITVRIIRNIFSGDYESVRLHGPIYTSDLKKELHLKSAVLFRGNTQLSDNDIVEENDFITAQIIPKGATATMAVLVTLSLFAAIVGTAVTLSMIASIPSARKLQENPSLRGSVNTARKNQMLPILLGKHRVYPDVAALPFSVYKNDDQYLRQLFCFGYKNVSIDRSTIKIGETLIDKYDGYTIPASFSDIYSQRCIESSIGLKLSNDGEEQPIERTTASNTWKICIGIMAPSGISGKDDEKADVGIRLEYRNSGTETWTLAAEETISLNADKFRKMYEISPSSPGTFDIRITRTNQESEDGHVIDTVYFDVMQSWTQTAGGSKEPITESERFSLLGIELKATDQLNGIIDELNAVCTLKARNYTGTGTGPSAWTEGDAVNPASIILYLLTDPYANPSPLSDEEIVWAEFEDFYQFCEEHGFECNAYITNQDYSIEDICTYIADSNLAQIRYTGRKAGIIIDAAVNHYTQLFTPRNAWNFSVQKSFKENIRYFRIKYVDASLGYEETERTVSLDAQGDIVFDTEIPEDETGTEINLFGVTDPEQAAYVGRQRLREISRQKRTFTWTSDVEGILCAPGDVVLIEHSQFSIGLGEGRIKRILKDENGIVNGVELDTVLPFEGSKVYSMIIRSGKSISPSLTIGTIYEGGRILYFRTTPQYELRVGDLCAIGEQSNETVPVMITTLERDENSNCKVTAVDYDPAIYEEGDIPPYDPGISKYPDAGDIGTGAHLPDGYVPPSRPGADGGDPRSLFQYSASPYIAPDDAKSLLVWGGSVLAWGSKAFIIETGEWKPTIEYPPPAGKPYLWEKYWSYELNDWQILCRTTLPTPDFEIIIVPSTYPLTSRGWTTGSTRLRVTCRRINTDDEIIWTVPQDLTYAPVQEGDNSVIDIFIPDNLKMSSFIFTCYVEGVDTKSFTVTGIPEGKAKPIYCGVVQAGHLPENTTEGDLMLGDHIIIENEDGTRDPYYYDGERWVFFDDTAPASIAFEILQNVLWDGTQAPATENTVSAINIFARNLATNTLFAFYAKIRNLLVGDGGDDFSAEIYDYQNGTKVPAVFRIRYKNKTIFQIDPQTGNIFFGKPNSQLSEPDTGFMYNATEGSIKSKSGKVVIYSDGRIYAKEADIEGSINATNGVFKGTLDGATGFFTGSLDTPSFTAMPNGAVKINIPVSGNAQNQVSILDSAFASNNLTDGFLYKCDLSVESRVKYVVHTTEGMFNNPQFSFYAEDGKTLIGRIRRYDDFWMWARHYSSTWDNQTFTVSVYKGDGNVFKFKDLPTEALGLETGQVWVDDSGVLHMVTEAIQAQQVSNEDKLTSETETPENQQELPSGK